MIGRRHVVTTAVAVLLLRASSETRAREPLRLDDASSGRTFSSVVGSTIDIDLSTGFAWSDVDVPASSSLDPAPVVLKKLSGGGSDDGGYHAVFEVVHGGNVTLRAAGRARCPTSQPCPTFMLQWSVLVTVSDPL